MNSKSQKKGETRQAISVPIELWEKLKRIAERENRSTIGQLRFYLEQALSKEPD